MTIREAARVLRVRVGTVRVLISRGELRAADLGDAGRAKLRIHPADIEAMLTRRWAASTPGPRRQRKRENVTEYF
ncbi:MAG TPA: helix-turn-helix domain-containing protein [Pirellulales bacterium]|nr:helix-turn-helix domain-containing protein [Pirellulales bacterium]